MIPLPHKADYQPLSVHLWLNSLPSYLELTPFPCLCTGSAGRHSAPGKGVVRSGEGLLRPSPQRVSAGPRGWVLGPAKLR